MSVSSTTTQSPPTFAALVGRQFIGGSVGGLLLVGASHPWDTIKTRVQSGEFRTVREAFKATVLGRGMSVKGKLNALYRGATPPLALQGLYSASLFAINQTVRLLVAPSDLPLGAPLPLSRVLLAAVITAPVHTLIMTPMDGIKIRLQAMHRKSQYTGPIECIQKALAGEGSGGGGLRALWSGYLAFAAVRTVGFGPYFVTFDATKTLLTTPSALNGHRQLLSADSPVVPLIGGSCAGAAFWVPAYPFDIVKTTIQLSRSPMWEGHARRLPSAAASETATVARTPMRYSEAFKYIMTNGNRAAHASPVCLYRGFWSAIVRAVPANAALWFGVKETEKFLTRNRF